MRRKAPLPALGLLAAALLVSVGVVRAGWASRPGKVIVPYPAGGATDVMGRFAAEALSAASGQRFIVENKGGASGALGSADAEKAAADGLTFVVATPATHVTNAFLRAKLPYDPNNFEPVALLSRNPLVLIAHSSLAADSVGALVALAKKEPGKLNYASSGTGATSHLAPELFKAMAGLDIAHVPYRGAGPALTDLIAGQVPMMFDNLQTAVPQIEGRKVKVLGVTSLKRWPSLPDVPAIAETVSGYEALSFLALMAPKGTPRPIVDKANAAIRNAFQGADMAPKLAALGVEFVPMTPEELAAFIGQEREKWGALIKERGLKEE